MLVQMENFNGIFIATTNLMSGLDQASLRRFDMKLEFCYLKTKQAWRLFKNECKSLSIKMKEEESLKNQIQALHSLAPGDFAAVKRQHKFNPISSAQDLIERLKDEIAVKENNSTVKMGFL
jgi:SpoVK/Ycf46/Vps4 family AAA+-type ATPase